MILFDSVTLVHLRFFKYFWSYSKYTKLIHNEHSDISSLAHQPTLD